MRIIGTIEARMGSSRLPGKTMQPIFRGAPLLEVVVERFRLCREVADVMVATTVEAADDEIAVWCEDHGVRCFRGAEEDVLDRVAGAASWAEADAVVQMGADSAYLDYRLIDSLVYLFRGGDLDYVCNDLTPTYPVGIYGHVVSTAALVSVNRRADIGPADREDVVRYIWEHPGEFRILNVEAPPEYRYPELRFTIDYPEDLTLAREIYRRLDSLEFTTDDLLRLYMQEPGLFEATRALVQRSAPYVKRDR